MCVEAGGGLAEVVLELDETTFPGGIVHHEVEVEVLHGVDPATVESRLYALLSQAGVGAKPSRPKVQRFFEALAGELA
jgi:hypothetical protein